MCSSSRMATSSSQTNAASASCADLSSGDGTGSSHGSTREARTAAILSILATCIAHDISPRAYLHLVTRLIVRGWPNSKLRELLPDRIIASHPELYVGDASLLSPAPDAALLTM